MTNGNRLGQIPTYYEIIEKLVRDEFEAGEYGGAACAGAVMVIVLESIGENEDK